jgi:hypothetical protein
MGELFEFTDALQDDEKRRHLSEHGSGIQPLQNRARSNRSGDERPGG